MDVTLHQAIFGYDGGHQLLASSTSLGSDLRYLLVTATDLSGSAPPQGFDQTCTGMPLPGSNYYALFATWLAPEMPRPGCVWSHVLLIEFADLAQIPDLNALRRFFRRPSKGEKTPCESICLSLRQLEASGVSENKRAECWELLAALYGKPRTPATFEADDEKLYSDVIFSIWSQQWPRLRRTFRFSTGSFGDRSQKSQIFDLQIVPKGSRFRIRRTSSEIANETIESSSLTPQSSDSPMDIAVGDLVDPTGSKLRGFLIQYGLDTLEPRSAYIHLVAAYCFFHSSWSLPHVDILRYIAESFPDPENALQLKETLVQLDSSLSNAEQLERTWSSLTFLLTEPGATAYRLTNFNFEAALSLLWPYKQNESLSILVLLVRQQESPAALAFAKALALAVRPADLHMVSESTPELVGFLIQYHPQLAFEVETWELPFRIQPEVYETLERLSLTQDEWAKVEGAMMIAATTVRVKDVVEKSGSYAVRGALRWLDAEISKKLLPTQIWREALSTPAETFLRSTEDLLPAELALCAWFVTPERAGEILNASRVDVSNLAKTPLESLPPPLRLHAAFLLMALGLRARDESGLRLILRSFYEVHDSLADRTFAPESWSLLSHDLPYLYWWEWDRCKKLKIAVRKWLLGHVHSIAPLVESADSYEHRQLSRSIQDVEEFPNHFSD